MIMKTIIVKVLAFAAVLALCLAVCSCELNSYSAFMMTRLKTSDKLEVTFASLSGRISETLSNSQTQDTTLSVEASIESGELEIYYTPGSYYDKLLLCKLHGEDSVSLSGVGYLTNGESVKITLLVPDGASAEGGRVLVTVDAR